MDQLRLKRAAEEVAPYLNWVISTDGDGSVGTGLMFAGATVGTSAGTATVALTVISDRWVTELTIHDGSAAAGGVERHLVVQTTGAASALEAWNLLLELASGAGSIAEGLKLAEEQAPKTQTHRMAALGLVGLDGGAS